MIATSCSHLMATALGRRAIIATTASSTRVVAAVAFTSSTRRLLNHHNIDLSSSSVAEHLVNHPSTFGIEEQLKGRGILDQWVAASVAVKDEEAWMNVDSSILYLALYGLSADSTTVDGFRDNQSLNENVVSFLRSWKRQSKECSDGSLPSPDDILQALDRIEQHGPHFQLKVAMVKPILSVVIHQSSKHDAPEVATKFLKQLRATKGLLFGSFTYDHVLQAWAKSGRPEAVEEMNDWLDRRLPSFGIAPHIVTMSPLLRYYGERGDIARMEAVLERMKDAGLGSAMDKDPCTHRNILVGYAKGNDISSAQKWFQKLQLLPAISLKKKWMIRESKNLLTQCTKFNRGSLWTSC